jgi:hypothetical protein
MTKPSDSNAIPYKIDRTGEDLHLIIRTFTIGVDERRRRLLRQRGIVLNKRHRGGSRGFDGATP